MKDTDNYLSEAQAQLDSGRLPEARAAYARVCELDASNAEARMMLGLIDGESGKTEDALKHIQQAIDLQPDYEEAYLALAGVQRSQGNLDGALQSCLRAANIDPEYEEAWLMLGAIQGALGHYADAELSCRSAIELWDNCVEAYVNLGNALKAQNKWSEAADIYKKALALESDLGTAELGLCSAYVETGKLDLAEPLCKPVLEKFPDSEVAHYNHGRVLQEKGLLDEAAACYRQSLKINFNYARAQFYLGTINQSQGLYDIALDNYKKVIELLPDFAPVYFHLGLMQQILRQLDEATTSYKRALELNQDRDRELSVNANVQLGYVYKTLLGQKDEAVNYYKKVLELDPDHLVARHYLASLGIGDVPDQASDEYVSKLFDDMSDDFEHVLVNNLNYHTPELIVEAVRSAIGESHSGLDLDVLDLGCGTGLCGPLIRDTAGYLTGIDLSPKIIKKAEEKNIYDDLIIGELTEVMNNSDRKYNVVLSADVFVYIGNLEGVFSAVKRVLKPGGIFAFSTEAADAEDGEGFELRESGRYAHTLEYIRDLTQRYEFTEDVLKEAVIRMEGNKPIDGRIFILKKDTV